MKETRSKPERDDLMQTLVSAARRRWLILLAGLALLALLFVYAGMIRTPGARKNPYTVVASRALAVAGAVILIRIVLLTHEDGVPVLLIDAGGGGESVPCDLSAVYRRFDVVPLSDVSAYIREQRYVPPKGVAVVIGVSSAGDLKTAAECLGAGRGAERIPVTILMPEDLAAGLDGRDWPAGFEGATLGLRIGKAGTGTWDEDDIIERLKAASERLVRATGVVAEYAALAGEGDLGLMNIGKAACIEAFFGGAGLNRYGDRADRIRLMDVGRIMAAGRSRRMRLSAYTTMYRGNYMPYPLWAWLDITAPLPD